MSRRYRLTPTPEQARVMVVHCGQARFVWNLALEQAKEYRPGRGPAPSSAARMRQLAELRGFLPWLADGSSSVQQAALRDFAQAMSNFFAGTHAFPTPRRKSGSQGFVVRDVTVQVLSKGWAEITVPKAGKVRFRVSRALPKVMKSARVTVDGKGRWHVSFPQATGQPEVARPARQTERAAGIDVGVATTLVTSDKQHYRAPIMRAKEERRLEALQRTLARQKKGSANRRKTKTQIAALHQGVKDRRKNWVETITTRLVRGYDVLVVEDNKIRSMTKAPAPKPDPEKDGAFLPNGAAAKAGLNKKILEQGWGLFRKRLKEKCDATPGVVYLEVKAAYSSRECHVCGHTDAGNRESQAVFTCGRCGRTMHADENAAKVVLARGIRKRDRASGPLAPTPGQGADQKRSGNPSHPATVAPATHTRNGNHSDIAA